jgi:hypothetical protein
MDIRTKFSIGQEVFAMIDNACVKTKVVEIQVKLRGKVQIEKYKLHRVDGLLGDYNLFATEEALFDAKKQKAKNLLI